MFLREWEQYEALMSQRKDQVRSGICLLTAVLMTPSNILLPHLLQFGKALSTEEKELLDGEQKKRLESLKDAAKLVGETIS